MASRVQTFVEGIMGGSGVGVPITAQAVFHDESTCLTGLIPFCFAGTLLMPAELIVFHHEYKSPHQVIPHIVHSLQKINGKS